MFNNPCEAKNFVPPHAVWRWNFFKWMVPVLLAALLLGLFGLGQQYARIGAPVIADGPPDSTIVRGTGTAGSTIDLQLDGKSVGTTTVDDNGQWSLGVDAVEETGDHQYVALALDPENTSRGTSNAWAFAVGPEYDPPTIAAQRDGSGFFLSGSGAPGTTVEVFNGNESLGIANVDDNGNWSLSANADPYNSEFVARGSAPDGSDIGDSDTLIYGAAALTAGGLNLLGNTYSWGGTGEPGSLVAIMLDGEQIGTTRVDSRGNWSFTGSARNLPAGEYTLTAATVDADNNVLANADNDAALSIAMRGLTAGGATLAEDGSTFAWGGTGEPGSEVVIMLDGEEIGRTTVDADGNWTFEGDAAADLGAGDYALSAQMLDANGTMTDELADAVPLTIAAMMAGLTTGTIMQPDGSSAFSWSGTGEPGSEVVIMLDGEEIGRTTVDADGNWTFDGEAEGLEAGEYALSAQMLDSDGAVIDDAAADDMLMIVESEAVDLVANDPTVADDGASFTWSGTGIPGSEVVIMLNGEEIGRTTIDADGNWTFEGDTADLDAGDYELSAQMLDADGAISGELMDAIPLTLGAGISFATNDPALDGTALTWGGTGEPGSEVVIMLNGEEIGRTTVDADGNWTFEGSVADLDDGDYELSAQMLNADGEVAAEMTAATPLTLGAGTGGETADLPTGQLQLMLADADPESGEPGTAPAGAPSVSLILDSSWSMTFGIDYTGQDVGPNTDESQRLTAADPNSRIAVAKAGLIDLIENGMPTGTPTALRVFGNLRGNLQCQTDLMVPYGPLNKTDMIAVINGVEPAFNANTTIARSLELVAEDLADAEEGNRNIVLVTDGDETCGGDPQAVIESLVDQGFEVTINVIGFAINDDALKSKLEGWAEAGNGQFFDASDADGLSTSLRDAFAIPYIVRDASGAEVAMGRVGGDPLDLPVGEYSVLLLTNPTQSFDIEITEGETITVSPE